ncbi:MAG: hypothetical protein HYT16_02240 [DPANN group archaeon]|nr:hypothetical protein [DPANN group archaeon]
MKLSAKVLAIPAIALIIYLAVRLANQALMLHYFPMDGSSQDWCSHITNLFFLDKYGFHATVPNWYSGNYVLFRYYPFMWHFFSLPFLRIFGDATTAAFVSLILMYALGFLLLWKFGAIIKIPRIARIAFFAFFFANPVAIGVFLKLGKLPEMFGWLVFFGLACLIYFYKNRKVDFIFPLVFVLTLTILFYTHVLVFVTSSVFVAGFIFYKLLKKEFNFVLISVACGLLVILLASPLLLNLFEASNPVKYAINSSGSFYPLKWLLSGGNSSLNDRIFSTLAPLLFIALFAISHKINKNKDDLLFYSLPLAFSVAYLLRLPAYLPIINRATPDMYSMLLLFYSLILLFKLNTAKLPKLMGVCLAAAIIVASVAGIGISAKITPWFSAHGETARETIELLENVNGTFVTIGAPVAEVRGACVYSYGAVYKNLKTPLGWSPIGITNEKASEINAVFSSALADNCRNLKAAGKKAGVTDVILYGEHCSAVGSCFDNKIIKTNSCLIKLQ